MVEIATQNNSVLCYISVNKNLQEFTNNTIVGTIYDYAPSRAGPNLVVVKSLFSKLTYVGTYFLIYKLKYLKKSQFIK